MPRVIDLPIGTIHVHCADYPPPNPNGRMAVIDGDTFVVGDQKWRLYGWDGPPVGPIGTILTRNTGKHPHCPKELEKGWAAKKKVEQLLANGANQGILHIDIMAGPKDAHGRWLVRIYIGEDELGEMLAECGLAESYDGKFPKWGFCDCEDRRQAYEEQLVNYHAAREEVRLRRNAQRRATR